MEKQSSTRRFGHRALVFAALMFFVTSNAFAQCSDPSKHFRGGLWKHWIYQIAPGPMALAAVQRIINEMNVARNSAGLPLLVFDPDEPIQVSIIEENNPRGPDGLNLVNRLPNQEIAFVTFAELKGAFNGEVGVFLTDPLRSNSDLTAKGIPGEAATFERRLSNTLEGSTSESSIKWLARNATDLVRFSADYPSQAIVARSRFPGAATYLNCNLGHLLDIVHRSRPTETFSWFDRFQSSALFVDRPDVHVDLKVKHHDPDIQIIFNDPANKGLALAEFDRIVRIERQ